MREKKQQLLKRNFSRKDSVKKSKLPKLSVELTSVMFSAMLFALEDKNQFMGAIPAFLAAPGDKEILDDIEGMLKKNLDQAINFVCLLSLAERLFKQENSARATVSLIYIVQRIFSNQNNEELSKKQSQQLWSNVWDFVAYIPKVAKELEEREKTGDLQFWCSEVQDFARRRWRTLKYEQMPRVKAETEALQKRVAELLKIEPEIK